MSYSSTLVVKGPQEEVTWKARPEMLKKVMQKEEKNILGTSVEKF